MAKKYYWGAFILDSIDLFIEYDLNRYDYSIFFLLCKNMDKETNIVTLRQKDIKDLFEDEHNKPVSKSTISKSIKKLVQISFITKAKNRPGFMINPSLFYFGSNRYLEMKIQDFEEILKHNNEEPIFYFDQEESRINKY
ncbi:MAG: MarR family transcriptional regulator [Enterococcus sp.]|nr:MarR family transcriptional regulator [Enterococcus sp.]